MKDYIQPFLRNMPNHFTYVSTNDLYSNQTAESIANTIIDHATSVKNDQHNTNTNTDNTNLNEKRSLVNNILAEICKKKTYFIDHSWQIILTEVNFISAKRVLSNTLKREISRVFNRQFKNNSSRNFEEYIE